MVEVSVSFGFEDFICFLVYFSISFGVFNLLLVLVFDGGYIVYYIIELIWGKLLFDEVQGFGF